MTKYTFEIQWPQPFAQGWQRSSGVFLTTEAAAKEMAAYLTISADNGVMLEGRLAVLPNESRLSTKI